MNKFNPDVFLWRRLTKNLRIDVYLEDNGYYIDCQTGECYMEGFIQRMRSDVVIHESFDDYLEFMGEK